MEANVLEIKNVGVINVQEIIQTKMQLNGVQEHAVKLHKIVKMLLVIREGHIDNVLIHVSIVNGDILEVELMIGVVNHVKIVKKVINIIKDLSGLDVIRMNNVLVEKEIIV
tara:strand:+ start:161 stop:493 length:333 start_codon:yes stop_codon:yes gene_type:complete